MLTRKVLDWGSALKCMIFPSRLERLTHVLELLDGCVHGQVEHVHGEPLDAAEGVVET